MRVLRRCLLEPRKGDTLLSGTVDSLDPAAAPIEQAPLLLPAVQVLSPSGIGDVVRTPSPFTIQWSTSGFVGAVATIDLYYDTDNQPGGQVPIAANIADTGQFPWQIPTSLIGTQVYIEAVATAGRTIVSDYSDAALTIRRPVSAPLLNLSGLQRTYVPGGEGLLVDPQATLADADSSRFIGGSLVVNIEKPGADDSLDIRSLGLASDGITTADGEVFFQGRPIGRFGGGQDESPLQITFSEIADLPAVQALIRNISFTSKSTARPASPRTSILFSTMVPAGFPSTQPRSSSTPSSSPHQLCRPVRRRWRLQQQPRPLLQQHQESLSDAHHQVRPEPLQHLHPLRRRHDSGADQNPDNGGAAINSNMRYAAGAHVMSATHDNLNTTLNSLSSLIHSWDYLLFWSFDHGGGAVQTTSNTTEEQLIGWGSNINDDELAPWLNAIHTAHSTYVHTQCFAGGMQDDIQAIMPSTAFSMSATNHYEYSWGDSFAAAFNRHFSTATR